MDRRRDAGVDRPRVGARDGHRRVPRRRSGRDARAPTPGVARRAMGLPFDSERVPSFRASVNRVRLVAQPQDLGYSGSNDVVTQSPKPIRKHWGPSRRYAPHGAHSTPAPATRDEVTARPIQPRRRASLPTVAERAGRPMAPDDRPPFDGGRTRAVPSACLSVEWFENQRFSSSRKSPIFERPRWTGSHAGGVGLVGPSPHSMLQG